MASLSNIIPGGFNARAVEPQAPRDNQPIPAGLYTVEITKADVRTLNSGNGTGLDLEFTVIDPQPFARRKVWATLNIQHSNAQAEQIAQAQLSALCRAVGIDQLNDTDQLFQRVVRIRTKIRPASGGYEARAEVTGFEQAGAPLPAATPTAAPAAAQPAKAAPWARKAAA